MKNKLAWTILQEKNPNKDKQNYLAKFGPGAEFLNV